MFYIFITDILSSLLRLFYFLEIFVEYIQQYLRVIQSAKFNIPRPQNMCPVEVSLIYEMFIQIPYTC